MATDNTAVPTPGPDDDGQTSPGAVVDFRWRVFLRVVDAGSLSKAATALAMPQSMVSRAISHLERQCGDRLFVRTGRGVVLTEFAAQILPRVRRLAADADLLRGHPQRARPADG